MSLLTLRGLFERLRAPSQSQKGHFSENMNALNDTKTSELSKSAEGNGEYLWSSVAFVKAWIKSKSPNAKTGLKTTKILHKNKACYMHHFYLLFKYAGAGAAIYISQIRKGYLPSIIVFGLGGTPHRMHSWSPSVRLFSLCLVLTRLIYHHKAFLIFKCTNMSKLSWTVMNLKPKKLNFWEKLIIFPTFLTLLFGEKSQEYPMTQKLNGYKTQSM